MTKYFEMAFKGRDEATEFEKATVELFQDVFGFEARHVGSIGLTPDVLLLSDENGYQAILDNKAYHKINKKLLFEGWTVIRFWGKDIQKNVDECVRVVEETIFEVTMQNEEW